MLLLDIGNAVNKPAASGFNEYADVTNTITNDTTNYGANQDVANTFTNDVTYNIINKASNEGVSDVNKRAESSTTEVTSNTTIPTKSLP